MFEQILTGILLLGLIFQASGFLVRDELVLRLLVIVGMSCDIAFYALQPIPILQSVATNGLLVAINLYLVTLIVLERTTLAMSETEKELFSHFPTLRPGQFRRILKHATWRTTTEDQTLLLEGRPAQSLFFVFADRFEVEKRGRCYGAQGPAFVGELVFLRGGESSASVHVPSGTQYVEFNSAGLKRAMRRSAPLHNAMLALFGNDLAEKVARSVPIEADIARSPGVATSSGSAAAE